MTAQKSLVTDVAIIGTGGAGLAAAIEANKAGARVTMVEQNETLGGSSIISGGGCFIVGSPLQQARGFHDTPDNAFEDWVKWGRGSADEPWARFYIEHSLHDLYFWAENLGTQWIDLRLHEGNRVPRWHRPLHNGLGITTTLIDAVRKQATTDILTAYRAGKILTKKGRVCGLEVTKLQDGQPIVIQSKVLLLATGGFNANLDMVLEAKPELKGYKILAGAGVGATGIGHKLVREIGGHLTHMNHIWFYAYATPDYRDPGGKRGLVIRKIPGSIWINQQGHRFHNESRSGGASATPALMAQDPPHAWALLDAPMAAGMEVSDPYYRRGDAVIREKVEALLANSPHIRKADTLSELGHKIKVDLPAFLATVEQYNRACEDGLERDPEFGKSLTDCKKIATPPFYAIQFFPLARKNFGGVKSDMHCRVLNKHFEIIPGLYAAGELTGMAGGHINGSAGLEGTMLGPSIISGRVAGAWGAQEAGFGSGFVGKPNRS
ncbi:MAG: FAD-dependent oxidoreductase [Candidatus Binatia bacterium]